MTRYVITILLDNGNREETEEVYEGTAGDLEDELVDRLDDRESQWKSIGDLTINFRHINGFRVEDPLEHLKGAA